jgi:hypothetical protein
VFIFILWMKSIFYLNSVPSPSPPPGRSQCNYLFKWLSKNKFFAGLEGKFRELKMSYHCLMERQINYFNWKLLRGEGKLLGLIWKIYLHLSLLLIQEIIFKVLNVLSLKLFSHKNNIPANPKSVPKNQVKHMHSIWFCD